MQDQTADVVWRPGNVPVSTQFDDPYFSLENGLAETRHVFLQGNDLPGRFRDGFHIAELGFGTGLSFLTTLQAWQARNCAGTLSFTSFEAYPMARADMAKALSAFDSFGPLASALLTKWQAEGGQFEIMPGVILNVVVGDAQETLAAWTEKADAWYLDGFSPAKNPALWTESLMRDVAKHTVLGGTFATYTAAGFVRRSLAQAGFHVERVVGFGRKRHMTRGTLSA
ncbi:tRNA (5-methylaminomethyl-2-thiouridine)(34)-methyltransferase MnmD [Roseobacter weihaiensis]|uniref:tRNA (5-methylaminomethyl-2-thiouridine)(34)-methyltransferase MnmD n=1 Tax=Roseobacter weihaiensis TaxID=2763262 RepID=UPI001D0B82F1|nr:tRNA (5-methylaminomethyl-2-thiouridine)(34)-methyltransferase MnmD [Roseobacter sp. H9]